LINFKNKITKIRNKLKKNNQISVNKDIVNNINMRKNSLNNYDFISNKRKYSTLNKGLFVKNTTNLIYVKITQILKLSADNKSRIVLSNKNKQLQIKKILKFF